MTAVPTTTRPDQPLDVLLLDAEIRQTLVTMRVLGRAGYRVGAVASASQAWWAPSLQSRYCALRAVAPDLAPDAAAYAQAILDLLDEHPARLVVPPSDGTIHALRLRRAEFERRSALPLASEAALEIAISKRHTLALARELGLAVPRTVPLADASDLPAAVREVGLPAVIKPVESWAERRRIGTRLSAEVAVSLDDARRAVDHVQALGGCVLLQEWLPGRREAVTQFYAYGRFWARMAQRSYREWPHLGGTSVLCETIALPADLSADAARLVQAMDLEGSSMVEFRRDARGRAVLMEVNPRMAGSVALAVSAGVNMPELMARWKLEQPLVEYTTYRTGRRLRWLAGDVWNLQGVFAKQGQPDVPPRLNAAATFVADFFRPNVGYGLDRDDVRPLLAKLYNRVAGNGVRRARAAR